MSLSKRFTTTLLIAMLAGSVAQARNQAPQGQTLQSDVQYVQIVIQSQQISITARSTVVEMQLQVFDQKGEMVYDSGLLSGSELSWTLQNASGEAVPSGLYAYKLSVKEANAETSSLRRGHLIVERGRDRDPQTDRLWVTSQGPVGADASLSGGEMTVSSGPEANVVGARIARSLAERGRQGRDTQGRLIARQDDQPVGVKEGPKNISGAGTTNRITKWSDGPNGVVSDSTLTEVGGNIGIGTTTPITGLDYRHILAPFLTRDIGTTNFGTPQSAIQIGVTNTGSRNIGVGPSFLFFSDDSAGQKEFLGRLSAGWENPTDGQEAGFVSFNVRANSADIGALTERMRITSAGNVGIGIANPAYKLHVVDSTFYGLRVETKAQGGAVASFGGNGSFLIDAFGVQGGRFIVNGNGDVGIGKFDPSFKLQVVDSANRGLRVESLSVGGTVASFGPNGDFQVDASGVQGGRFIVKESGNVGIGTPSPVDKLHVSGTGGVRARINSDSNAGLGLSLNGQSKWSLATTNGDFQLFNDVSFTNAIIVNSSTNNVGIGTTTPADRLHVANGFLRLSSLGVVGTNHLCLNSAEQISFCSSSLRYKTDLAPFRGGLNLVNRLHPITFKWKTNGEADLGLGAEDVAKVEPLLVTHNDKGEIEGVKYDRIAVVLLNAIKEQQKEITEQQQEIKQLKKELRQLQASAHRHWRRGRR